MNTNLFLEATEQAFIDSARASVESILEGSGLNLIINNAAIAKLVTLDEVKTEDMMEHYRVNCVAPLMVTKVFVTSMSYICVMHPPPPPPPVLLCLSQNVTKRK